jgi:hypothetical protein
VSRDASFLALPCETVARLIASDELPVDELHTVAAVRRWFESDAAQRKGSLKTLMPLIRWPLLPVSTRRSLCDEPLFTQLMATDDDGRTLSARLLLECGAPDSRGGILAAGCPRLNPRRGMVPALAFDTFSTSYRTGEDGALLETVATPGVGGRHDEMDLALCNGHVMNSGKNCAEITFVQQGCVMYGVASPVVGTTVDGLYWMIGSVSGLAYGGTDAGRARNWPGQEGLEDGDVVRLLLNSETGSLTVKKNGVLLGTPWASGLTGDLCWAVWFYSHPSAARIKAVDPKDF